MKPCLFYSYYLFIYFGLAAQFSNWTTERTTIIFLGLC